MIHPSVNFLIMKLPSTKLRSALCSRLLTANLVFVELLCPSAFGYDEAVLGSYTPASAHEKESFYFSLLFIGYAVKKPLSKEDRLDLYKHEYAHYMQYNMKIPAQYNWQAGKHGSAWKYCCSLVGAAPTPYYRIGESLLKHDYDKALKNPIHDKTVPIRDTYRREQAYKSAKHSEIKFQVNDVVTHPKFGEGTVRGNRTAVQFRPAAYPVCR